MNYHEYINSEDWESKRAAAFEIHGYWCSRCGSEDNLQAHHLSYENLGNENPKKDLIILCKKCHLVEHKLKRKQCLSCDKWFTDQISNEDVCPECLKIIRELKDVPF